MNYLVLPSLYYEDGTSIFSYFFNHRSIIEIFRFKSGYQPLFANIIGYISVRIPVRLSPYFLTYIPFLFITLPAYFILFLKPYRIYIRSDILRFFICILLILNPIASLLEYIHTDYSIWNSLLLLIFISIIPFPSKFKIPYFIIYNVLIWNHPTSIIILPVTIYFLIKDKKILNKLFYVFIIFNLIFHSIIGIKKTGLLSNLSIFDILKIIPDSLVYIFNGVIIKSIFGYGVLNYIKKYYLISLLLSILIIIIFLISLRINLKLRKYFKLFLFFLYYIFSITFLSILSRSFEYLTYNYRPRYLYIQSIFFTIILIIILSHLISMYIKSFFYKYNIVKNNNIKIIFLSLFLIFLLYNIGKLQSYSGSFEDGYRLHIFYKNLDKEIKNNKSFKNINLIYSRDNDSIKWGGKDSSWNIKINTKD